MNKIFRVIWNHSTKTWQAVSELAKGQTKSESGQSGDVRALSLSFPLTLIALALLGLQSSASGAILIGSISNTGTVSSGSNTGSGNAVVVGTDNNGSGNALGSVDNSQRKPNQTTG